MYSMTGYATCSFMLHHQDRSTEITITLKSFNNRFFEVFFKLPIACQAYEVEMSKVLKERLMRGSIQCIVLSSNTEFFQETVTPSINAAKAYYDALSNIKEFLHIHNDSVRLEHLVRMPNLFTVSDRILTQEQRDSFFDAFGVTISNLNNQRRAEGDALKKDIISRLLLIENEMEHIKRLFVARIAEQKKRVQETLQEIQVDESVLASSQRTALYTMLDKLDLQEEVTRFESHKKSMLGAIESETLEKGKRIDFTLQEMLREDNTILAKCSDSEISARAITIKVELEKIREQIQNVL